MPGSASKQDSLLLLNQASLLFRMRTKSCCMAKFLKVCTTIDFVNRLQENS